MTVKEFKETDLYKIAIQVNYFDLTGMNISNKPSFILDLFQVIGAVYNPDTSIDVTVNYLN